MTPREDGMRLGAEALKRAIYDPRIALAILACAAEGILAQLPRPMARELLNEFLDAFDRDA
jgi:hypothetical protein